MRAFLLAAAFVAASSFASTLYAQSPGVAWKTVVEVLDEAPKAEKMILLDVYTDWCTWCKRMDRDTYADSAVASYIAERFVAGKMNPEKEGSLTFGGKELSQREFGRVLGVTGYPATVMFDETGKSLGVVPGYNKPKEFLIILKYFGERLYKTMSWEEYLKANM